ncbi:MAG: OmpA family protein [Chitinophagaceae bacterium]|nr:OmpA family protein [Chitinophagaceae bacterium]
MNKKIFILLLTACPVMVNAQADGWLNTLNYKIKNKATARAESRVDQAINNTADIAEGKNKPVQNGSAQEKADTSVTGKKLYAKYDFIPGEQVIYSNDFATDNMGELPTGWNSNGNAAVVTLDVLKGNWVQLYQNTTCLTDNDSSFSENFTVEFDLVLRRTNEKAPFPEFVWGVLSSGNLTSTHNNLLKDHTAHFATEMSIQPSDHIRSSMQVQTFAGRASYFKTDIQKPGALLQQFNKVIHVAMQVQKERLRIWFNEEKLYDLPKAISPAVTINQLYFIVKRYGGPEQEVGYAVGNIKIAKGLPDTRHKLLNEGRLSTTGILFNINSHTLLPQSNAVLNEIAGVLAKHSELSIRIIGHTDSDGDEAANQELSEKRAASVKQFLVRHFNIDASRIESEGAGESQPIGDNHTREGKANNRRVEFVRR